MILFRFCEEIPAQDYFKNITTACTCQNLTEQLFNSHKKQSEFAYFDFYYYASLLPWSQLFFAWSTYVKDTMILHPCKRSELDIFSSLGKTNRNIYYWELLINITSFRHL